MSFWDKQITRAEKQILRQNKRLALTHNFDFKKNHPDEARDLSKGNPNDVLAKKRIHDEMEKHTAELKRRNDKLGKGR